MVSLPNHAGCPNVHWRWWATTATPCWTCSTAANPSVNPLPSLPDYGWTPLSMRPRQPRQPGQNGRPPLKGARRPALKTILLDQPQATWASVAVAWYDGATRTVELTSQTAVWYRSGKSPVRIRWVLIRDPQGSFATQALLCTDPAADPTQILEWFVLRWQLEVTFPGGADPPGPGNPTPVVRPGHRPHHARPAGNLLLDHPGRPRVAKTAPHDPAPRRPGTTSRCRPSWTPLPWCDATCGWPRRVFQRRPSTPIRRNSQSLCTTDLSIPWLTPLEMRKVQLTYSRC